MKDDKLLRKWAKCTAIIEEKVDGANVGISFSNGKLTLQSRNNILHGDPKERQFDLFKSWATELKLYNILKEDYILFGEWCYAKHKIFYNKLPDYFLAYDVFNKSNDEFLISSERKLLLNDSNIHFVKEIHRARFDKINNFSKYIGNSHYKTHNCPQTKEDSLLMEGVYVRVEDENKVVGRMKVVRPEFEKVRDDDFNWLEGPIQTNIVQT